MTGGGGNDREGAGMTGVRRLLFPGRVIIVMMDSCFRRNDRGGDAGMTGVRRLLFPGRVIIVMMDSCFRRNDRGGMRE